ncbi:GDP-4-keto-6-deoxy-D-mannose-3, 5-epimerase-4-reductase [Spirochaeta lutea]|uniref:GDP-L-fucose synthase n=1 Tax=Spirochaeta lutea TaxID=1480694 RepID=A0A098QXA8_9SPIO|nr:GDP-L-fucose synthase [Spirochaeta lutea]KGE71127.1 GDP-4-keto-6-deoxy-D-mannose-3, 5-epimerase-4-reductase [Spirochaeta lutea]
MNQESKIFLAGHRGLVGSAIHKNLLAKGYNNIITRTHAELELTNQAAVDEFFLQQKPEYVFLAAAKVGGIVANNTYRGDFIYTNLMIQNNVIHSSYVHGVKKLLFLGSTCIYPRLAPQPMPESCLLTGELEYTNEPYAIAKIAGIKLCESYNIQYGTNFLSVMPTNLYGPGDNFDLEKSHVLPALLRKLHLAKLLHHEDFEGIVKDLGVSSFEDAVPILDRFGVSKDVVEIWGSGKPRREFLWSEDMADACVFIMEHQDFSDLIKDKTREIRNTHINIGTGIDISIRDLAELLREVVGFPGDLRFNPDLPDGTYQKLTDVSKLNQLGWKYSTSLEQGLPRLYENYLGQP